MERSSGSGPSALSVEGAFQRMATPVAAARTDAPNTASFAAAKSEASANAWPAMKSDIVKPIPASAPAPTS